MSAFQGYGEKPTTATRTPSTRTTVTWSGSPVYSMPTFAQRLRRLVEAAREVVVAVVVRQADEVDPRPGEGLGVRGRGLEGEAVARALAVALRRPAGGVRALEVGDHEIGSAQLGAHGGEEGAPAVGRHAVLRARRRVAHPADLDDLRRRGRGRAGGGDGGRRRARPAGSRAARPPAARAAAAADHQPGARRERDDKSDGDAEHHETAAPMRRRRSGGASDARYTFMRSGPGGASVIVR